ncbi:MAG: immunoglobulin domain-containing protein [Verrucomicrobia bacterium]|nr:immunoglobulin domain-containing protein [Verrucomicrobiota bacterium]
MNSSSNLTFVRKGTALAAGLLLSGSALLGQTIPNPSFELDTFTVFPGYISGNAPITGWTGSPADRVGLNPAGGSAFANNGAIPNGTKVAFIQSPGTGAATLSTVISGLTAGQIYTVNFRLNARTNNPAQTPVLKIGVDGQPIVNLSTIGVQIGGLTTAYRFAAFDFTAAADTATLWLTNDAAGDTTVLVDDFSINASTNHWSYAAWNDDASSGVDGSKTYTHAYNLGTGAAETTINGVLFRVMSGTAAPNEFSTSYGSTTTDAANALLTAGGGSSNLARSFLYGGNAGSLIIGDLVPGMEYVATFYAVAWETGMRAQTFSYGTDRMTINQDHFNNDQGIRIMYRYVAPASGAITLTQTPLLPAATFHTYGFANYEANPQAMPIIGLQPRSQVTAPAATYTFSVTAGGARPLFFQWLKDGVELTGETNRFLTRFDAASVDLGGYSVIVSNANGAVTSSVATLTFGPIANPSFEADVFHAWPGYASVNQRLSGWLAGNLGRVGVNPFADGVGPFANNGAIPDGNQVGFIQSTGTNWLSTRLDGLTPGQPYTLAFRLNARNGQTPTMHATIDDQPILDFRVGASGTTNAFKFVAFNFTPANEGPTLYLTNESAGDHTVLLDDFRVAPATTKWSFAPWTDDPSSGVDSTKGYSHAYSFATPVDAVINGIYFKGIPGANPSLPGKFATAGYPSVFNNDANTVTTNGGGGAALARDFIYGGVPQVITLSNLVPGVEYVATVYSVGFDPKAYGRAATFSVGDDRLTVNQDHFGNDTGIRVSYRYTADASGTLTLTYGATHNAGGTPSSIHTYGFSNYELASTNAPIVYLQPQPRTVAGSSAVTFYATVGGEQPLFLQWQKDGVDLAGQNSSTLNLASVGAGDGGIYTLLASNIHGVISSAPALLEVGLPMANASFEADTFTVYPGYVSVNFPITGWTSSLPGNTGLNPVSDLRSPFADNGLIPDGNRVAFIQADNGVLSQVVTGMVVGQTYYVKFYENARASGLPSPTLSVTLGGTAIVPAHIVPAGAYVRVVSGPFLATSDSAELAFVKTAGPAGGDSTVVIDNVAVLDLPPSQPSFTMQPQGAFVKEGDAVTLSTIVRGTLPMGLQWQREGTDVADATNAVLALPGTLLSQAGHYRLIATNIYGAATSAVAVVRVGLSITELFNTGVDDTGALAARASVDRHYQVVSSVDPAFPGPDAILFYDSWPIPPYLLNGPVSAWISARANDPGGNTQGANLLDGLYVFRTAFLFDTLNPATAEIRGKWAMDNFGVDVRLNGISLGLSNNAGFAAFGTFAITNGFVAGSNTLDFVISNAPPPGPMAFRAEFYGVAEPLPAAAPQIVFQPQSRFAQELDNVEFTVLATGSPTLTYQWFYEGLDLLDETNRTLRLTRVSQLDQQGNYTVVVANSEGQIESNPALLTINAAPIATDDFIACGSNQPVTVPPSKLLFNDVELEGDGISILVQDSSSQQGGTVTFVSGMVVYTPPLNYVGTDRFTYTIVDSRGGRATANVFVTVGATNFLSIVVAPALLPNGHFQVGYSGIPGYPYTILRATNVAGPWLPFADVVADGNGFFQIDDPNTPPEPVLFFRATYP